LGQNICFIINVNTDRGVLGIKDDSYTCTKTLDKNYCGIYNHFLQEASELLNTEL